MARKRSRQRTPTSSGRTVLFASFIVVVTLVWYIPAMSGGFVWDDDTGFHLENVLLHALCALLVWRVPRVLGVGGAWFAAAVFALHPIHVESVAWVTERKNVLSGVFYLASLLAYLRFSQTGAGSDARDPAYVPS